VRGLLRLAALALGLLLVLAWLDRISLERANRLFRSGQLEAAAELYRSRADRAGRPDVARYNLGTALLAQGSGEEAEAQLRRALESRDSAVLYRAYHNLGYHFLVGGLREPEPAPAARLLAASVAASRAGLRRHPGAEATAWNLELAERSLDSLSVLLAAAGGEPEEAGEAAVREAARELERGGGGSDPAAQPVADTASGERGPSAGDPGEGAREALASDDPGPLSEAAARSILDGVRDDPAKLLRGILWSQGPKGWWWDRPVRGGTW
jgi:tetratricopeptide (TPR) repeat protein